MKPHISKMSISVAVLFLICCLALHGNPISFAENDIESSFQNLLQQMTLDEEIGQMIQPERSAIFSMTDITKYGFGSIFSSGDGFIPGTTPEQVVEMVDSCQAAALQTRLKIPLLYGIDAVHGFSSITGTTIFPHNIGMGASGSADLVKEAARVTADEMAGTGIRWAFAPCIAVARDIRWGRTYESYGETPDINSLLGVAAVNGLQGDNFQKADCVLACVKHYLGDGGTLFGTGLMGGNDQGDTKTTEEEIRRLYLPPYVAAVKAGAGTVMVSYSSWNGQKMHSNRYLITKILKEKLGFDGFVVSDFRGFEKLPGSYPERITAAVNAGIDMFMGPSDYQFLIATLKKLVEDGQVSRERIDDAATRILRVKYEMGLFERPYANRKLIKSIGSPEHREVARQCVRASVVLLKNKILGNHGILPLSKDIKRILIAGAAANDIGAQCGGWTVTWQGQNGEITKGTTILEAIRRTVSQSTVVTYAQNGKVSKTNDVAIVVVGEKPYAEFQGDISNPSRLELCAEDKQVIENVKKLRIPMVAIIVSGRPLVIADILNQSKAFIAAWLPGTEGQGVADVLFGDYHPTGRLPFSWPKDGKQAPIHSGDEPYDPLFKYGYGLSY
jgi:beta-glucosidase